MCRRPDLDHTPVPPTGGRFDRLFADGTVVSVDVARGDLLVAFGSPAAVADRAVVARVHDAVVEAARRVRRADRAAVREAHEGHVLAGRGTPEARQVDADQRGRVEAVGGFLERLAGAALHQRFARVEVAISAHRDLARAAAGRPRSAGVIRVVALR